MVDRKQAGLGCQEDLAYLCIELYRERGLYIPENAHISTRDRFVFKCGERGVSTSTAVGT